MSWKTQDVEKMSTSKLMKCVLMYHEEWRALLWNFLLRLGWRSQSDHNKLYIHHKADGPALNSLGFGGENESRGQGAFVFDSSFPALFPYLFLIHTASFVTVTQKQQKAVESESPNQCWPNFSTSQAGWSEHRLYLRFSTHGYLSQHLRQKLRFLACLSFLTSSWNICLLLSSRKQDKSE